MSAISQLPAVTAAGTDRIPLARLSSTDVYTAGTISAAASDNSLNDSAASFPAWLVPGLRINIAAFTGDTDNNHDSATVVSATTAKVVLGADTPLVDDAAGESVTITAWESKRTTAQDVADLSATSGPSVASRYVIDLASQTDSDPGAGKLRFNHATPTSATKIFLDDETSDGVDLSTALLDLGASGYIRIQSVDDVGEWMYAKWTAITDDSGYFDIAITVLASKGTLDDTDAVLVTFDAKGSAGGGSSLPWIDVTDPAYGATGDGTTDDTAAIALAVAAVNAAAVGAVLYFPTGTYKTSGGFSFSKQVRIVGDSCASSPNGATATALSTVTCTSTTAHLFTFAAHGSAIETIHLLDAVPGTRTAGSALRVTAGNCTRIHNLSVYGFYNQIQVEDGYEYHIQSVNLYGPLNWGLYLRNIATPDGGDANISDISIIAQDHDAAAAIRVESGGGIKINNLKINGQTSHNFSRGIDLQPYSGAVTSIFLLCNSSIENISGPAFYAASVSGSNWDMLMLANLQIALYGSTNASAIVIAAASTGQMDRVSITGCSLGGSSATGSTPAINLTNIDQVRIGQCLKHDFGELVAVSGVTDFRNDNARYEKKTLTDAATIAIDNVNYDSFRVTLGGNRTLGNPAALHSGQVLNIRVAQSTGGHTLTRSSKMRTRGGSSTLAIPTAAGAVGLLTLEYDGTTDTWFVVDNSVAFT
jgi:hypothetical protein